MTAIASELETDVRAWGERLAAQLPKPGLAPSHLVEQRMMRLLIADPRLRAALFRFVDVRPACLDRTDLVRHLDEYLADADTSTLARRLSSITRRRGARRPTASLAAVGVAVIARRFIAGDDTGTACAGLGGLWRGGMCCTVDLLGEATLTESEGRDYEARCVDALNVLARESAAWPERALLEADDLGALCRVNLSVKVSAMTPQLRANAPERAVAGARERLRGLLRTARDLHAHLHVDMESMDTRSSITELVLELLAEPEFAAGPSAGIVLQAYLTDSEDQLALLLSWVEEHPRGEPFTVRLVKGAYWDHEVVQSAQYGWRAPVLTDRRACDRQYERFTRRLLDAHAAGAPVRVALASHNLRSIAHGLAYSDHLGLPEAALELQVLRGLGEDTAAAVRGSGRRARVYSPVGDLVAGMAYLVRRLLENSSNDSFLAVYASGVNLDALMEEP